ncbi:hypothetical protein SAMN05443575_3912 [Jatrophihabitans endophyticus]|uniref:Uncharacterized protein n=1 Tax=Jatrophihabitans endophyticus TaxID=1206085 RepID=A0A1M5T544_9ACTN|nr:hypothetical protein [Jatrophihabitans endophyticus]SHH45877.1 hypothetical protein SAMN05443575_3912 [Jatrophihabitans endophyticus]
MSRIRTTAAQGVAAAALAAGALALLAPATAEAKTTGNGDFAATVNGTTYNPAAGKDVKLKDVTVGGRIAVRGVNVRFDFDTTTLGVYDYALTGAPTAERMVTSPTVIFASKVPQLTAAQLARPTLTQLEIKDDTLTAIVSTAAGKMKVQAKDSATGGIFQMEPEFGSNVTIEHKLGPTLFYFVNQYTGKINFGDGLDPVASGPGAHQMLLGKDSPQVATKTFQDGSTTRWSVASGGRMGGVLGEDAIELSAGATNCTSQCQAQNRIHGSLPVPPLPTDPTPIGS